MGRETGRMWKLISLIVNLFTWFRSKESRLVALGSELIILVSCWLQNDIDGELVGWSTLCFVVIGEVLVGWTTLVGGTLSFCTAFWWDVDDLGVLSQTILVFDTRCYSLYWKSDALRKKLCGITWWCWNYNC